MNPAMTTFAALDDLASRALCQHLEPRDLERTRDDEPAVKLGESKERPDYNVIAEVLAANKIEPKIAQSPRPFFRSFPFFRDGRAPRSSATSAAAGPSSRAASSSSTRTSSRARGTPRQRAC